MLESLTSTLNKRALLKRIWNRFKQMMCSHAGHFCTYDQYRARPDKGDPRVWCVKCGWKGEFTADDAATGKICKRLDV